MKLKATIKWSKEKILVEPVLFPWRTGMHFKILTGYASNSLFCNIASDFIFPPSTKFILLFIRVWYFIRMYLWMQIRYWQPYKIKRMFKRKSTNDDLPF